MGRLFLEFVEPSGKLYQCRYCLTDLATVDCLVSKSFHSRSGKAYLFDKVSNVVTGRTEERLMTTGLHTVADIYCTKCWSSCGWKYLRAQERSQKYKEGKFILERAKLVDSGKSEQLSQQSSDSLEDGHDFEGSESDVEDPCT